MAFLDDVLVGIKTVTDATGGSDVPVNAKSRHLRISGDGVAVAGSDDAIDLIVQGADAPRAKVAATTNLTLAGTQTVDGVSCGVGDVVLLTGQTNPAENRLMVVQAGAWTPAPDMTTSAQIKAGMLVSVRLGTSTASTIWQLTAGGPFTLGVTALTWSQAGSASLVSNTARGLIAALNRGAHSVPVSDSTGTSIVHSKEAVRVASYTAITANDNDALNTAIAVAKTLFTDVICENKLYDNLTYVDAHNAQGVRIFGQGGPSYSNGGTTFRFTGASGNLTFSSSGSVTIGKDNVVGVLKTFPVASTTGVVLNQPAKAVSGAGTMYGTVESFVANTSITLRVRAASGSGSSSSWTITCATKPLIDFRSTLGCGLIGINVNLNAAGIINRVVDTSWYDLNAPSDSNHFLCEHVKIRDLTQSQAAVHFYFGTTIGILAQHCSSDYALVGMFAGNGPATFECCTFNSYSLRALETACAEQVLNSCVFEPGTAFGGVNQRLIEGVLIGSNTFGVAAIENCVFNDAAADAVGSWIRLQGMRVCVLRNNQLQSYAPQAPIWADSCGAIGLYSNVFNGSVNGSTDHGIDVSGTVSQITTIYKAEDNNFAGSSFVVGTAGVHYFDYIDGSATINALGGAFQGYAYKRNFASFFKTFSTFGVIVPPSAIDLSLGVDLAYSSTHAYNSYASGPGQLKSLAFADDGTEIDITHSQAQTLTITNGFGGYGTNYRPILTGTGGNVTWPAASATAPIKIRLRYMHIFNAWILVGASHAPNSSDLTGSYAAPTIAAGAVTSTKLGASAVTNTALAANAVTNAKVDAAAAIDGTKISPAFGAQNITVTDRDVRGIRTLQYTGYVDNGNSGTAKTLDLGAGAAQKLTLTGNCTLTITAPAGMSAGVLRVVQDGTGGRSLTFPTAYWPDGTAAGGQQPSQLANEVTIYDWFYDGTNLYIVGRGKQVLV